MRERERERELSLARVYGVTCTINRGPLYVLMVLRDIFYGAEEILIRDKDSPRVERLIEHFRTMWVCACLVIFFSRFVVD